MCLAWVRPPYSYVRCAHELRSLQRLPPAEDAGVDEAHLVVRKLVVGDACDIEKVASSLLPPPRARARAHMHCLAKCRPAGPR